MTDFPVRLTELMHLNALSTDLALTLQSTPSLTANSLPWSNRTFSHYADARRLTSPPQPDIDDLPSSRPAPLALPQRDAAARRAARQAAALRARTARTVSEADSSSTSAASHSEFHKDDDHESDPEMYALLRKRGRKTRIPRRRMFVLRENTLYNFKTTKARKASWKLSLHGAVVGLDPRTLRIVLLLHGQRTLVLYAENAEQARQWTEALAKAADSDCRSSTSRSTTSQGWDDAVAEVTSMTSFVADQRVEETPFPRTHSPPTKWATSDSRLSLDIPDIAADSPDNDNWDSFRSFAALQIQTGRTHPQQGSGNRQPGRMKYSRLAASA